VILDPGVAFLKCVKGMAKHGMCAIYNVKSAHNGSPKNWLMENAPDRGQRPCATKTFNISVGEAWSVLGACDKYKQPVALVGTTCTTSMGKTPERNFTIIWSDGNWNVKSASLEQLGIREK